MPGLWTDVQDDSLKKIIERLRFLEDRSFFFAFFTVPTIYRPANEKPAFKTPASTMIQIGFSLVLRSKTMQSTKIPTIGQRV